MDNEESVARLTAGLGQMLLRFRTENNLTRSQLAERLELSEGRIRQLESGDNAQSFKIDFLFNAARALDISPVDLLSRLMHETKLIPSQQDLPGLQEAFLNSVQTSTSAGTFKVAIGKQDSLFGNHFAWSLKMAEMLLNLDERGKVRLEIALRRASPLKTTDEYRARTMHLLDVELDYPEE